MVLLPSGEAAARKSLSIQPDGEDPQSPCGRARVQTDGAGVLRIELPPARYRVTIADQPELGARFDWTAGGPVPTTVQLAR